MKAHAATGPISSRDQRFSTIACALAPGPLGGGLPMTSSMKLNTRSQYRFATRLQTPRRVGSPVQGVLSGGVQNAAPIALRPRPLRRTRCSGSGRGRSGCWSQRCAGGSKVGACAPGVGGSKGVSPAGTWPARPDPEVRRKRRARDVVAGRGRAVATWRAWGAAQGATRVEILEPAGTKGCKEGMCAGCHAGARRARAGMSRGKGGE